MPRSLTLALLGNLRFDGLFWRKFAYLGCVYGPEWWKRYSPPAIAAIIFALVKGNRDGATANLMRVLGTDDRRIARRAALRMFAEFAHCMTETMEHYGPRPRPLRIDTTDPDYLGEALARGRGAVVVTGHFGNWDIAAKQLKDYGRPINVVMAREANLTTQEYVRAARERAGVRIIYSDSSVFSSLNMLRALKKNEIVALQLDRLQGTGGARLLPFFGAPAPFASGPFVLARIAGAPIVPSFIPRLATRHYAIRLCGRFTVPRERADVYGLERVMAEVVRIFESMIRQHPTQWFQFTPFWPDTGASALEAGAEARTARA